MSLSPDFDPLFLAYVGAFAAAAVACFATVGRTREIADADTRRGLVGLLVTSGGWAAAHVGFLTAPTVEARLGFYVVGLVLGVAAVGAWLYVCSAYTGRTYHRNPTYRRWTVVVFAAVVVVKVTNPLHHRYFTYEVVATPFPHLAVHSGPLHWSAMGLAYALSFVGYFVLFELLSDVEEDATPLLGLVGVTGLPVVLDVVGFSSVALVDITYEPLGVAVFAVGVGWLYLDRFQAIQFAAERDGPVVVVDAESRVQEANRSARVLFPDLTDAVGQPLQSVLPAVADRLDADERVLEVTRDGATTFYRLTDEPLGTTRESPRRAITFTDVTDSEEYRRDIERQNARLERFASVVSHDLRNPLNVARGRVELAREDGDGEHLDTAVDALDRMDELIEDILAVARGGKPVEETERVALSAVAGECWEMVETEEGAVEVEDDVGFAAAPDRLRRLFENLFRNAIEHAGPGVTVTVGPLADGTGFYVADDGPGIPPADREDVFESGYTTSEEGTGFGLAIVSEVAEAHGWSVSVTESEDGGARFEFSGVAVEPPASPND